MKNKLFFGLLVLLGVFSVPSIVFTLPSQASIDKNECRDAAPKDNKWSEAEKWVWKNLCEQKEADLNEYIKSLQEQLKKNDSKKINSKFSTTILANKNYNNDKKISAKFLMEILTNKNYSEKLPIIITIKGANFDSEINLQQISFKPATSMVT